LYGTVLPRRRFFAPSSAELGSLAELRESAALVGVTTEKRGSSKGYPRRIVVRRTEPWQGQGEYDERRGGRRAREMPCFGGGTPTNAAVSRSSAREPSSADDGAKNRRLGRTAPHKEAGGGGGGV
jgi:hypothetical protein